MHQLGVGKVAVGNRWADQVNVNLVAYLAGALFLTGV